MDDYILTCALETLIVSGEQFFFSMCVKVLYLVGGRLELIGKKLAYVGVDAQHALAFDSPQSS